MKVYKIADQHAKPLGWCRLERKTGLFYPFPDEIHLARDGGMSKPVCHVEHVKFGDYRLLETQTIEEFLGGVESHE